MNFRVNRKVLYIVCAGAILVAAGRFRSSQFQQAIADDILRFHVVANSDSKLDQSVKLKVRDEIGSYMNTKLKNSENLQETMCITKQSLPEISEIAEKVLQENGYEYGAKAELKEVDFPVKQYGNCTFPAGNYQALKVTLGKGEGKNWWCVMYPNMCFAGSMYEVIDEETKVKLQEVLTAEEYTELLAESKITVKFKYWEKIKEIMKNLNVATAPKDSTFQVRINAEMKKTVEEIYARAGMTLTDVFNTFIQQSINVEGLPFLVAQNSKEALRE